VQTVNNQNLLYGQGGITLYIQSIFYS